jgi:hypothetical protein
MLVLRTTGCPQNWRPLSTENADVSIVRKSYKNQQISLNQLFKFWIKDYWK